jgi:hypothetical protein
MAKLPTLSIRDLTSRQLEFFNRALREDPQAAESWDAEGYTNLGGRFGLYGIVSPAHPFE